MCLLVILFTAFVLVTNAQHHGSVDGILCYRCDNDHDVTKFPACLKIPIMCGSNQVCRIRYGYRLGGHIPHIQCIEKSHCEKETSTHSKACSEGGVEIRQDLCQACCLDNTCVTDTTSVLQLEVISSANLFCPHRCHVDNLKECVDNGNICDHGDYCEVKVDRSDRVKGDCKDVHMWNHCNTQLQNDPCPEDLSNKTAYSHSAVDHCTSDCCDTNLCLFKRFGLHLANASFPTNQQTPTASPGGQGSDLWDKLHGSCVDTFTNETCEGLKTQSDLCHNRLALSLCPKTCGICDVLNTSVCRDKDVAQCVLNKNASSNFCETDEATFTCPTTCNICDKLLDSIIVSLIDGSSNATEVPASLVSTSNPSTKYPTVNCEDLKDVSCEHLLPVCQSTFLNAVCPDQCTSCLI